MAGRRPIPTALKLFRNNPGHVKLPTHEPQPTPTGAEAPSDLTEAAKAIWDEIAPDCVRIGTLTGMDRGELALACRLRAIGLAQIRQAEHKGTPGREFSAGLKSLAQSSTIFARFGVGASDRTRLSIMAPPRPGKRKGKWAGLLGEEPPAMP
jgi:hypothetical protein